MTGVLTGSTRPLEWLRVRSREPRGTSDRAVGSPVREGLGEGWSEAGLPKPINMLPPSTGRLTPVMPRASSLHSHSTALAMSELSSHGRSNACIGLSTLAVSSKVGLSRSPRIMLAK